MAEPLTTPAAPAPIDPAALRLVLFGMPDAGKSSLLGALDQAAQTQEHLLNGQLTEASPGLAELRQRLYEERPRETLSEIVPYAVTYTPFPEPGSDTFGDRLRAVLIDCDGRVANDLLARQRSLDSDNMVGALARAILEADVLVLVVDVSAAPAQMEVDFAQFTRFLRLLEQSRGRRTEVSGLPVFLVLTKCDLLAKPTDTAAGWLDRIEQRKTQVNDRFRVFVIRDQARAGSPFGRIDLHLWATAVKRPALANTPAKPTEPYGVAELFRQAFEAARVFRRHRDRSRRRLLWTLAGSGALVIALGLITTGLLVTRQERAPNQLETRIDRWRAQEQEQSPVARHRDLPAKIEELTNLANDPAFAALPENKQEDVRRRLRELRAYQSYETRLNEVLDPRDARSLEQLSEIETTLSRLEVPAEYRTEWSQTPAGRRHAEYLEDVKALRSAVAKVEAWYQKLNKEGQQVLDNASAANLPARAKKVLDEARTPPFPEREPDKSLQGDRRVTYATVFAFTEVAEARRKWEEDVKKKLEPYARLESP
jgi:hypothetical protein